MATYCCVYFLRGHCLYGERCVNAHDRSLPVPFCKSFQDGTCSYGTRCLFRHEIDTDLVLRRQAGERLRQQEAEERQLSITLQEPAGVAAFVADRFAKAKDQDDVASKLPLIFAAWEDVRHLRRKQVNNRRWEAADFAQLPALLSDLKTVTWGAGDQETVALAHSLLLFTYQQTRGMDKGGRLDYFPIRVHSLVEVLAGVSGHEWGMCKRLIAALHRGLHTREGARVQDLSDSVRQDTQRGIALESDGVTHGAGTDDICIEALWDEGSDGGEGPGNAKYSFGEEVGSTPEWLAAVVGAAVQMGVDDDGVLQLRHAWCKRQGSTQHPEMTLLAYLLAGVLAQGDCARTGALAWRLLEDVPSLDILELPELLSHASSLVIGKGLTDFALLWKACFDGKLGPTDYAAVVKKVGRLEAESEAVRHLGEDELYRMAKDAFPWAVITRETFRQTITACKRTKKPTTPVKAKGPRLPPLPRKRAAVVINSAEELEVCLNNMTPVTDIVCSQGYDVTDADIARLADWLGTKLVTLRLGEPNDDVSNALTDHAALTLAQQCPNLMELSLHASPAITDAGFVALVSSLRRLEVLHLTGSYTHQGKLTHASIHALLAGACPTLKRLYITDQPQLQFLEVDRLIQRRQKEGFKVQAGNSQGEPLEDAVWLDGCVDVTEYMFGNMVDRDGDGSEGEYESGGSGYGGSGCDDYW